MSELPILELTQIPSPEKDPIGYDRACLNREIKELGSRTIVNPSDLTDQVIAALGVQRERDGGYGNLIMTVDTAKRNALNDKTDLITALNIILTE